ncbi:hypothetical protein C1H46_042977 [Malus baccata]|uniref:Response regulatory domain-containing protein n=1 Tax=Malus baccata TaxID=106549 RepID=A0A540KB72_MALBA|nr:hypothetical protein C1H46_042977 [Malus baccata]
MNDEKAASLESMKNSTLVLEGVNVLAVDGDSACLSLLSRMLCQLGYKVMSDDENAMLVLGGLFKGVVYYIIKPLTMDSLKNQWQFAFINNRDAMIDVTAKDISGEFQQENTSSVIEP